MEHKEAELTVLADGAAALGLRVDRSTLSQLLAYLDLLDRWNKTYNLTAIRERPRMITHHLLDSLAVVPVMQRVAAQHAGLVDIGSGGGVPGVVLAIMFPDMPVSLVEPVQKKCAFLRQCAAQLKLPNLTVLEQRVQHLLFDDLPSTSQRPNLFTCRAYTRLIDFAHQVLPLCTHGSRAMAMKSALVNDEVAELRAGSLVQRMAANNAAPVALTFDRVDSLTVPGINAPRSLVWLNAVEHDPEERGSA